MTVTVDRQHFEGREQALERIAGQGLFARDGAMSRGDLEDVHWHRTSLLIYVLTGCFETLDAASGSLLPAGPGDLISIPRETLHAAQCPIPATYVVGFESAEAAKQFRPEQPEDLGAPLP